MTRLALNKLLPKIVVLFLRYLIPFFSILLILIGGLSSLKYILILSNTGIAEGQVVDHLRTSWVCRTYELCIFTTNQVDRVTVKFNNNQDKQFTFVDSFYFVTNPYVSTAKPTVKVMYFKPFPKLATSSSSNLYVLLVPHLIQLVLGIYLACRSIKSKKT